MATITDEGDLQIALVPTVPLMKYHDAPLHFMSQAGLSQYEYELKLLTQVQTEIDDEIIHVMCPDKPDGTGRSFKIKRSSLSRSPTFVQFFKSRHYLKGCKMQITFFSDPATCFEIVQLYLDEGPDMYTKTRLRVFLTMNYRIVDRFLILIRLHLLATKLALPGLMNMAYDAIVDAERLVTPSFCITIASVVFSKSAGFDAVLKDWCLKHIGYHFLALMDTNEWNEILKMFESELNEQWSKLMEANAAVLAAINNTDNGTALERVISKLPIEDQADAISAIERQEITAEEFIQKVKEDEARQKNQGGSEDVGCFIREDDLVSEDRKAREMLGMSPTVGINPNRNEIWLSRSKSMPSSTAKARAVMGIDGNNGKVAGRKLTKSDHVKPDRSSKLSKLSHQSYIYRGIGRLSRSSFGACHQFLSCTLRGARASSEISSGS